ncbi:MAG: hypothetical protein KKC79_12780 [Gammaproteobacteria bacterium]|nr:hypothetical protein [Gammaproteobacteria bacterium]MBU1443311.1 hypothetical protein [Gammaproteobacteria bacterium]MBU2285183.1 hypothetical protein [Gammaproteobacteria bacterium]MBU2409507.1 hypothetical protein [Gammaproteobacteria bacterium]
MREIVDSHTAESVGLLLLRQPRLSHNGGSTPLSLLYKHFALYRNLRRSNSMFSTPSSRATVAEGEQLQFSISHIGVKEPVFLCTWSPNGLVGADETGAFLCSKDELSRFLLARNVPKLVALQVLVPSGPLSWSLRTARTVAHRSAPGSDSVDLVFSDDLELFDSWSERLPSSIVLIPLWSAPSIDAQLG